MNSNPRTDEALERLFNRYRKGDERAITVNFRELVDWVRVGDRATHYLHPYPAKLLPQIPIFFLSNNILSNEQSVVCDPFCGSGTVLVESLIAGRNAIGADANPLARLIASVKSSALSSEHLRSALHRVLRRARRSASGLSPDVINLEYWFFPHVIAQLSRIKAAIEKDEDVATAAFLRVCLSACVRRVSRADPRLSVPVRLRTNQYPAEHPFRKRYNDRMRRLRRQDVLAEFSAIAEANIARCIAFAGMRPRGVAAQVVSDDARATGRPDSSVDLIVTSPPYAGAQKYIRASSLELGWLDLWPSRSLRALEDKNIGREHLPGDAVQARIRTNIAAADRLLREIAIENPLRAAIAGTYLTEMRSAFAESVRILKPGGFMVVVAGNNEVCGRPFRTVLYLQRIAEDLGLITRLRLVDDIRSRGLMTRRNATASVITREVALVFEKPRGAL